MEQLDDLFVVNADAEERVGTRFAPLSLDEDAEFFAVKFSCPGPNPNVKVQREPFLGVGVSETRSRFDHVAMLPAEVEAIIDEFATDFPRPYGLSPVRSEL